MTNDALTYESRIEAALAAYTRAHDREPLDSDWGLQVQDDPTSPLGSTFRFFAWFETSEDLLDFMAKHLLLSSSEPPVEEELDEAAAALADVVDQVRQGAVPLRDLVTTSKGFLAECQTLKWVGTFTDLCTGMDDAAKSVRSEFYRTKNDVEEPSTAPISAEQRAAFVDFLSFYGV